MKHRLHAVPAVIALVCATAMTSAVAAEPQAMSALPKGVVATVNGVPIPQATMDQAVKASGQPDTPELRARIKRDLIGGQLVEQAADKAHYGSRPEVLGVAARVRSEAASRLYLDDQLKAKPVTDAQVKARYDAIVATAGQFEYRAQVVAVADAADINAAVNELNKGASFDTVAAKYNTTPNGGVAPWLSLKTPVAQGQTAGLPLPLAQAMTTLQPGAIAGPIPLGGAFALVKLDEKRPTVVPTFDQAKTVLRQQLEAQARDQAAEALIQKLAAQATIQQ